MVGKAVGPSSLGLERANPGKSLGVNKGRAARDVTKSKRMGKMAVVRWRDLLRKCSEKFLAVHLQAWHKDCVPALVMIDVHGPAGQSSTSGALHRRLGFELDSAVVALCVLVQEMQTMSQPFFQGLPNVSLSSCL